VITIAVSARLWIELLPFVIVNFASSLSILVHVLIKLWSIGQKVTKLSPVCLTKI